MKISAAVPLNLFGTRRFYVRFAAGFVLLSLHVPEPVTDDVPAGELDCFFARAVLDGRSMIADCAYCEVVARGQDRVEIVDSRLSARELYFHHELHHVVSVGSFAR